MLEILAILVVAGCMLAKHTPKRKYRRYLRGNVDHQLDLGTLAANTLVGSLLTGVVEEKAWVSSMIALWALTQFTEGSDIGPITVGVAHSDYTDAEVEEFIENAGSWSQGNKVAQEVARRKIKIVGVFSTEAGSSASDVNVLADGRLIRTKLNWMLTTGQTIRIWAFNEGSNPIGTTTPDLDVKGHVNIWPSG